MARAAESQEDATAKRIVKSGLMHDACKEWNFFYHINIYVTLSLSLSLGILSLSLCGLLTGMYWMTNYDDYDGK